MDEQLQQVYLCPRGRGPLRLHGASGGAEVLSGELRGDDGAVYPIADGIPTFIFPGQLSEMERRTQDQYDHYYTEEFYKNAIEWQFAAVYEDENRVREFMVDQLALPADARVLEVGCGTGMDSFRIARRLNDRGTLFLQDLSRQMVTITRTRLTRERAALGLRCGLHYFVSGATYLPFADGYFDAVFHFGGFNNFEQPRASFAEFARVTKPGGKVVVGDEGVAPWLRGSEFAEVLITNNPLFKEQAPIEHLPPSARDVNVRWIMANSFYLIDFRVGEGFPKLNLDLPHAGRRGGSMRTRYFGQLEGVSVEAKKLASEAAAKRGVSMHQWLDELVRAGAARDLEK